MSWSRGSRVSLVVIPVRWGIPAFSSKFVHQQDETGGSIVCTVFHIPVIAVLVEVVHQFLIAPSFGLTGFEGFGYFAFPSAAQTGPVGAGSLHGGTCVICHQFLDWGWHIVPACGRWVASRHRVSCCCRCTSESWAFAGHCCTRSRE